VQSLGKVVQTPAGPVLQGALVCGPESKWGYEYPVEVWTDATLKTYENLPSFSGHNATNQQPDPEKKLGWFTNIRRRGNGQPEGDYHVNPEHPLAKSVVWAAEHNPSFYAFSHQAFVDYEIKNGRKVVKSITKPVSCDLVVAGATTGGIFEHSPFPGARTVATVKEYLTKLAPKLDLNQLTKAKSMLVLVKEGYDETPMSATAPDPVAPETTADGGMDSAFMALCMKEAQCCLDSKGDPAALKKCLGRMKKILATHGELSSDEIDEAPEPEEETEPVKEGAPKPKAKPKAAVTHATAVDAGELLTELATEGYTPTATTLAALKGITDKTQRIAFIKEQKGLHNATKPLSKSRDTVLTKEGDPNAPPSEVQKVQKRMQELARENQGIPATAPAK
jgi:hypothetical protein